MKKLAKCSRRRGTAETGRADGGTIVSKTRAAMKTHAAARKSVVNLIIPCICKGGERLAHPPNNNNQLVCVATAHNLDRRAEHDRQIEPDAPVVDVPYIVFYASLHCLDRRRLSARTIHLRATGNARFHALA